MGGGGAGFERCCPAAEPIGNARQRGYDAVLDLNAGRRSWNAIQPFVAHPAYTNCRVVRPEPEPNHLDLLSESYG